MNPWDRTSWLYERYALAFLLEWLRGFTALAKFIGGRAVSVLNRHLT